MVILEGLPQDYEYVISIIESKFENLPIDEDETLFLAHELFRNPRMSLTTALISIVKK